MVYHAEMKLARARTDCNQRSVSVVSSLHIICHEDASDRPKTASVDRNRRAARLVVVQVR